MKGQEQSMAGLAISVVIAAVAIIVAITVWSNIYGAIGNEQHNVTFSNATVAGALNNRTITTGLPVYYGPDSLDGISSNATLFVAVDNGTAYAFTLDNTVLPPTVSETFAISGNTVYIRSSNAGAIYFTYTQERVSSATNPTFANVNNLTYDAYSLAAVGLIVLAAVVILSLLFVLGRRA